MADPRGRLPWPTGRPHAVGTTRRAILMVTALPALLLVMSSLPVAGTNMRVGPAALAPTHTQPTVATATVGRLTVPASDTPSDQLRLHKRKVISGGLSPKSVVSTQTGLFLAQNMMYRHTVVVFDRAYKRVKTIRDKVDLQHFGFANHRRIVRGAPVEAAVTPDGKYAYISNYSMFGPGYHHPGFDMCTSADHRDRSFVYRIDLSTLKVTQLIHVGATPKYLAVTPDGHFLLVANWCSADLSVVRLPDGVPIRRIHLGQNPRGIAFDPASTEAYVAVWSASAIAKVDLDDYDVHWIHGFRTPRHLVMSPSGAYLYATLNDAGRVVRINRSTGQVVDGVRTGREPRSMTMAPDGRSLYVVNYSSGKVSKVRTSDMHVIQTVKTRHHPIGITYDDATDTVWVSCYSGVLMVFKDR